jgi:hypothetical protein
MKTFLALCISGGAIAAAFAVDAQPASAPAAAASKPSRLPPRPMTPAQQHDAAFPDLRPERPIVPQLSIPLGGKGRPERVAPSAPARPGKAASALSIGDAAARCEAEPSAQARAACRDRLAHQAPPRR